MKHNTGLKCVKSEFPIKFEIDVDGWLQDGFQIFTFTCDIFASLWGGLCVQKERGLWTSLQRALLALLE